jgi:hypothetical protein
VDGFPSIASGPLAAEKSFRGTAFENSGAVKNRR